MTVGITVMMQRKTKKSKLLTRKKRMLKLEARGHSRLQENSKVEAIVISRRRNLAVETLKKIRISRDVLVSKEEIRVIKMEQFQFAPFVERFMLESVGLNPTEAAIIVDKRATLQETALISHQSQQKQRPEDVPMPVFIVLTKKTLRQDLLPQ